MQGTRRWTPRKRLRSTSSLCGRRGSGTRRRRSCGRRGRHGRRKSATHSCMRRRERARQRWRSTSPRSRQLPSQVPHDCKHGQNGVCSFYTATLIARREVALQLFTRRGLLPRISMEVWRTCWSVEKVDARRVLVPGSCMLSYARANEPASWLLRLDWSGMRYQNGCSHRPTLRRPWCGMPSNFAGAPSWMPSMSIHYHQWCACMQVQTGGAPPPPTGH